MLLRRAVILHLPAAALIAGSGFPALAADKTVTIGINLPLTGADAHDAELIKDGAMLALDEANAKGGVAGYKINVMVLDDGTATAGQYDPAQAATNARKMVADDSVVAAIGPQMSGSGKAMSPILSPGRSGDHHAVLDQPRHHRSEIRRAVPARPARRSISAR